VWSAGLDVRPLLYLTDRVLYCYLVLQHCTLHAQPVVLLNPAAAAAGAAASGINTNQYAANNQNSPRDKIIYHISYPPPFMADPAFLAWCQQHGVTTHGVQPGLVSEGWRGILATQHIQPGTEVMCVPQQLLMSVMSARRDVLSLLLQHHQLNSHQVITQHDNCLHDIILVYLLLGAHTDSSALHVQHS
jgi:hypothetical protein